MADIQSSDGVVRAALLSYDKATGKGKLETELLTASKGRMSYQAKIYVVGNDTPVKNIMVLTTRPKKKDSHEFVVPAGSEIEVKVG